MALFTLVDPNTFWASGQPRQQMWYGPLIPSQGVPVQSPIPVAQCAPPATTVLCSVPKGASVPVLERPRYRQSSDDVFFPDRLYLPTTVPTMFRTVSLPSVEMGPDDVFEPPEGAMASAASSRTLEDSAYSSSHTSSPSRSDNLQDDVSPPRAVLGAAPGFVHTSLLQDMDRQDRVTDYPLPIGAAFSREEADDRSLPLTPGHERTRLRYAEGAGISAIRKRRGRRITSTFYTKSPRFSENGNSAELNDCDKILLHYRRESAANDEQASKRDIFLGILEVERERQRKLVLPKHSPKMVCKFCKNNGEDAEIYTKHRLHYNEKTVCPLLRHYVCKLCNSTGDFAHTIRHCPFNDKKNKMAWKATFMC